MCVADYSPGDERGGRLDTGLTAFVQLLALNQVAAAPEQILHDRGAGDRPFDTGDMLRVAKRLGLRARARTVTVDKLARVPLPAIGRGVDGSYFLIARTEDGADGLRALVKGRGRGAAAKPAAAA